MRTIRQLRRAYEAGRLSVEETQEDVRARLTLMRAQKAMADFRQKESHARVMRSAERLARAKGVTVDELLAAGAADGAPLTTD